MKYQPLYHARQIEVIKGGVWIHLEPKFVTNCKADKTPAIYCIIMEFFMQMDQLRQWFAYHFVNQRDPMVNI